MLGMGKFTEGGANTWVGQVSVHTVTSTRADSVLNSIIQHPLSTTKKKKKVCVGQVIEVKNGLIIFVEVIDRTEKHYGYMKLID